LAMSSLTRNSRYVGAIWIGIWFISSTLGVVLTGLLRRDWCPLVSYTSNLLRVADSLLDTRSAWEPLAAFFSEEGHERQLATLSNTTYPWYWSALVLAGLFGISIWILSQRVKSLDRLK